MELDLGWGRKSLCEQLEGFNIAPEAIDHAEKDADAILRLYMRCLVTDKMRDHAIKNIARKLEKAIIPK